LCPKKRERLRSSVQGGTYKLCAQDIRRLDPWERGEVREMICAEMGLRKGECFMIIDSNKLWGVKRNGGGFRKKGGHWRYTCYWRH